MLRIEIQAVHHADHPSGLSGRDQIDEALAAIGFRREAQPETVGKVVPSMSGLSDDVSAVPAASPVTTAVPTPAINPAEAVAEMLSTALVLPHADTATAPLKRERGKAPPGRVRRTKEEIAEDEAADAADRAALAQAAQTEAAPQIRVNPEDRKPIELPVLPDGPLTHEHVRAAFGGLLNKWRAELGSDAGTLRATTEMREIIGGTIADIPNEQAALSAVIEKINTHIAAPVVVPVEADIFETAAEAAPAKVFTREDVTAGAKAYFVKFGKDATFSDGPKIMGYSKLSEIPDDPALFEKLTGLWSTALSANPYGRTAVA